jgi:hypothetical protein
VTALASFTAPHPGTRCKPKPPPWHRRALARARRRPQWPGWLLNRAWHRQATPYLEEVHHDAFMVRVEPHGPNPYFVAASTVASIKAVTDAFNQPPAAVQPDRDVPGMEHLASGQYGDDTHAFSRYVDGGQE